MNNTAIRLGVTFILLLGCLSRAFALEIPESVKASVRARVDRGTVAGIVVGLTDQDGIAYYCFGTMERQSGARPTGERPSGERPSGSVPDKTSVFEIGSISKVFTGILLAEMALKGEVSLTDPVDKYLPKSVKAPKFKGRSITLVDLSTQTSGLPRMPSNFAPKDPMNPFADYTVAQLYEYLGSVKIQKKIGETYAYSNVGVGLLGHILELASGKSYEELVTDRICKVLKLKDTGITLNEDQTRRLARGHNGINQVSNWDIPTLAGAGALRSTGHDMLLFLQANMMASKTAAESSSNKDAGRTALLAAMRESHEPRHQAGSSGMKIGLGWHIRTGKAGDTVWHNGGTGGYRAFAGFLSGTKRGAVVLTNSTGIGSDDIGFHLLDESVPLR